MWHTEHHTRTVTNSDGSTTTESYTENVTDFTITEPILFERWTDESRNPDTLPLDPNKVIRIKLQKSILVGDHATREILEEKKRDMLTRAYEIKSQRYRGSTVDFKQIDDITGFRSSLFSNLNGFPWWMKTRYYCCMSLCGLTWLYRYRFKRSTQKSAFDIHKTVFIV